MDKKERVLPEIGTRDLLFIDTIITPFDQFKKNLPRL